MSEPTGTRRLPIVLDGSADLQQLRSAEVLQVPSIVAGAAATNLPIVITPTGTGAFQVSAGGNVRGDYALDFQSRRAGGDTQVASGFGSALIGCLNSTASNTGAFVCGGSTNIASGQNAFTLGGFGHTNAGNQSGIVSGFGHYLAITGYNSVILAGRYAWLKHRNCVVQGSEGFMDEAGRAQREIASLSCRTSAIAQEELFTDGDGGSGTLNLNYGEVWYYTIRILATKEDLGTTSYAETIEGIITRTVGGTQHVAGPTVVRTAGVSLGTILVDDPNSYLRIQVTPNTIDSLFWLAYVDMICINGYTA